MFKQCMCPVCRRYEECFILSIEYGKKLITYRLECVSGQEFAYYSTRD